jgi:hypothetical protein
MNTNADFLGDLKLLIKDIYTSVYKAITLIASHPSTDVKSSISSSELQLLRTHKSLNQEKRECSHLLQAVKWNNLVGSGY